MPYIAIWLTAIVIATVSAQWLDPTLGAVLYAVVAVALVNAAARATEPIDRALILSLALIPVVRLLAMSLPLEGVEPVARFAIVGLALAIGTAATIRAIGYGAADVGLVVGRRVVLPSAVLLVGAIGLSVVAAPILGPTEPPNGITLMEGPLLAVLLGLSTGLVEELYFRGLLQHAAIERLGRPVGVIYVSALFAAVAVDRWSIGALALVFAIACVLALVTLQTGSVIPAAIGHGVFDVMLVMVVPFVAGSWVGS